MDEPMKKIRDWRQKQQGELFSQDLLLLNIQILLIPILALSVFVFSLIDPAGYLPFSLYAALCVISVLSIAMLVNIQGHSLASLLVTLGVLFTVPWGYALYGLSASPQSLWPLLYLAVPLQVLSLFVPLRVTVPFTLLQLLGMAWLILPLKTHQGTCWIIFFFTVMLSGLSIAINTLHRQQNRKLQGSMNASEATERTLRDYSTHDPLTGLYNRRYMDETLRVYTQTRAQSFAILMVDLDHFKSINDLYGHVVGDAVLQQVSKILSLNHRPTDIACRYGGDEFIVILIGCSLKDAIRKAEIIKQQIAALMPTDREERQIMVTASIGVAHFPENGGDHNSILKIVDQTMYMAKQEGRNRVIAALAGK